MDNKGSEEQGSPRRQLGEDWLSVILGLAVVLLVAVFGLTSIPWPLFGVFG